jgi:GntR family transcriptional regulator, rspAB operon transcriptional repressor
MSRIAVAQRTRVERESLNEQVYTLLRRRLLDGHHGPHEKLSLQELANDIGVSRSPVHYALTRLVGEGLLIVQPRRGYFVAPLTAAAVENAYEVRLALELLAAERTVATVSDADLGELRRLVEATLPPAGGFADLDVFFAANQALHEFQIDLAGNELMSSIYRSLSVNLMMKRLLAGRPRASLQQVFDDHVELVEAFESRDLASAQEAIRRHVTTGKRIGFGALAEAGGSL